MAEFVSDVLIAGEETVLMAEVSGVGVPGPLGPFWAGFAAELLRQGYKLQPVGKQLRLVAALSGWLAAEGVAVSGLSSAVAERFCVARRAAVRTDRATVRALDPPLGYLRALGVAPPASSPAPEGPVEELLARFRRYLEHERGLVLAAARGYADKVRPFVARFDGPNRLELWRVDVAEVRSVTQPQPRALRTAVTKVAPMWKGSQTPRQRDDNSSGDISSAHPPILTTSLTLELGTGPPNRLPHTTSRLVGCTWFHDNNAPRPHFPGRSAMPCRDAVWALKRLACVQE